MENNFDTNSGWLWQALADQPIINVFEFLYLFEIFKMCVTYNDSD